MNRSDPTFSVHRNPVVSGLDPRHQRAESHTELSPKTKCHSLGYSESLGVKREMLMMNASSSKRITIELIGTANVNIVQRDRRGSRSGSDRDLRRKAVVRSGQDVRLWVFNRTDQQRGPWEARQVVIRGDPERASRRHWRHGVWSISMFEWPVSRCRAQVQKTWREA